MPKDCVLLVVALAVILILIGLGGYYGALIGGLQISDSVGPLIVTLGLILIFARGNLGL